MLLRTGETTCFWLLFTQLQHARQLLRSQCWASVFVFFVPWWWLVREVGQEVQRGNEKTASTRFNCCPRRLTPNHHKETSSANKACHQSLADSILRNLPSWPNLCRQLLQQISFCSAFSQICLLHILLHQAVVHMSNNVMQELLNERGVPSHDPKLFPWTRIIEYQATEATHSNLLYCEEEHYHSEHRRRYSIIHETQEPNPIKLEATLAFPCHMSFNKDHVQGCLHTCFSDYDSVLPGDRSQADTVPWPETRVTWTWQH